MEQRIDRAEAPGWVAEELDRVCAVLEKDMKKFGRNSETGFLPPALKTDTMR